MSLTKQELFAIARAQSALELGCPADDLARQDPLVLCGGLTKGSRIYFTEPFAGNIVSYGSNAVARVKAELYDLVSEYLSRYEWYRLFETPHILWLNERLADRGYQTAFMASYHLPDPARTKPLPCPLETRLLFPQDFADLYTPDWSNALCDKRRECDRLAVGAYDGDRLVGLAGCSADCEDMWQIGIDVLPAYRRQGIASALTSRLSLEILKRGKIPFYCCAWSNLPSARNAARSGFVPAWVELSIKPTDFVKKLNQTKEETAGCQGKTTSPL